MTTIVLADDHPMVRHGLKFILEAERGWSVVGEATTGNEVLQLVKALRPDVLILDILMPEVNGIEVVQRLSQFATRSRVVMFSMYDHDSYIRAAMNSGAQAYVLKDSEVAELVHAVREVLAGRRYLSRSLTERAMTCYLQQASSDGVAWSEVLTSRERQVIQLAAQGASNAEIGYRLSISPRTVETHRTNIMRKLGLHTRAELITYALQHGILPLHSS
ncbi:MAG: response regulator transcription factor [Chloroflexaceae bacterium]|nr:response regulator transcription factor [Chloroflexaceae bacterium]